VLVCPSEAPQRGFEPNPHRSADCSSLSCDFYAGRMDPFDGGSPGASPPDGTPTPRRAITRHNRQLMQQAKAARRNKRNRGSDAAATASSASSAERYSSRAVNGTSAALDASLPQPHLQYSDVCEDDRKQAIRIMRAVAECMPGSSHARDVAVTGASIGNIMVREIRGHRVSTCLFNEMPRLSTERATQDDSEVCDCLDVELPRLALRAQCTQGRDSRSCWTLSSGSSLRPIIMSR
jgi:hypothetical protein